MLLVRAAVVTSTLAVLAATAPIEAQAARTPQGLVAFLRSTMQSRRIPGLQIAVVQRGRVVMTGAYGFANLEDSVPVTPRTIFSINSATKSFTGVAIMQLVEEGKADLNAPVSRYVDSLPAAWQGVTLRQLLAHTSGIPNLMDGNGTLLVEYDFDASLAKARALPMEFAPGAKFSYNQTNYYLLGRVIDRLSGSPFLDVIRKRQLVPARMSRTGWGDFYTVVPGKAKSYAFDRYGDSTFTNHFESFPLALRTAAGINTTALELAQWIIGLQDGTLLKASSLPALWHAERSDIDYVLNGYAMGFPSIVRPKHPAVGGIGGGRSAFLIYPQDSLAVVVLTNRLGASPEFFVDDIAAFYVPSIKQARRK